MKSILDYEILEELGETRDYSAYNAKKADSKGFFIIKIIKKCAPTQSDIVRFKQEFETIIKFSHDGVIKYYSLENYNNSFAAIHEDFPGVPLKQNIIKKSFDIKTFLKIAIQLADALGMLHKERIVHKAISPHNILYNAHKNKIKISNFGLIQEFTRSNREIYNLDVISEILPYISPEQTGRLNRILDYRTDLYSLGITFYEMLTCLPPFISSDPLEIFHFHIAAKPVFPSLIIPDIPEIVSDIIIKLMNKTPEERYQNCFGLSADLKKCLDQLIKSGKVESFKLAEHDFSERFIIPQTIIGRERESELLLSCFNKAGSGGREIIMVSGKPGIGKSAIVNEIHKSIAARRGFFIFGKYERLRKDVPYSAIIQAFQGLSRQILTENEENIGKWKKALLTALGPNGRLMTDIIPDLELIIGRQPEVTEMESEESKNRFNLFFERFVSVFADEKHPLVLFLDDLQWADMPSLVFLKNIITSPDITHIFIIGAYRDEEISSAHALVKTIKEIEDEKIIIKRINLSPLTADDIKKLVLNLLKCSEENGSQLSSIIQRKTGGNPFFINQFLHTVYNENIIFFDPEGGWRWDINKINQMHVTDNVVEMMSDKIKKLPDSTREILKICACLGNRFDLETISLILLIPVDDVLRSLSAAINEGYISMSRDLYVFHHDRIQEAAYSLIPDNDKPALHYKIGRLLLDKTTDGQEFQNKIFYIADQMNLGLKTIMDENERENIAELNLKAGKKAMASNAYAPAYSYFKNGIRFLRDDSWDTQYELTLKLHEETAEASYLNGDYGEMEQIFNVVTSKTIMFKDSVQIFQTKIKSYTARNLPAETINIGIYLLRRLGVKLPEKVRKIHVLIELLKVKFTLIGISIEDIIDQSDTEDENINQILYSLLLIESSALVSTPFFFLIIILRGLLISLKNGFSPYAIPSIVNYGFFLWVLGNFDKSYKFGQLGIRLLEKTNNTYFTARTFLIIHNFINIWKKHAKEGIIPLQEAHQIGIENGDYEFASVIALSISILTYYTTDNLREAGQVIFANYEATIKLHQMTFKTYTSIILQTALNLMLDNNNSLTFTGQVYNEIEMLPEHIKKKDKTAICLLYINKAFLCYLFEEYAKAFENTNKARQYLDAMIASLPYAFCIFFDSLIRLAVIKKNSLFKQKLLMVQIFRNQRKMKKWARHAPMNYSQMYYLVEAEIASVKGKDKRAEKFYDLAVEAARENKYINIEAIASELAAKYYLSRDKRKIAKLYMSEAYNCYSRWGAGAKVKHLEDRYPELLMNYIFTGKKEDIEKDMGQRRLDTRDSVSNMLDLESVLKASQAISGEIVLAELLRKMMNIVIQNAGAQKGLLILKEESGLEIKARAEAGRDAELNVISLPASESSELSRAVVNFTARTLKSVVLGDAAVKGDFIDDEYIHKNSVRSVLSIPIVLQHKLVGILYLENNRTTDAFTPERVELLELLSAQAAISIENAGLYSRLNESEKKYRDIFENAVEGIFQLSPEGRFINVNKSMARIFGYETPDDLISGGKDAIQLGLVTEERAVEVYNLLRKKNSIIEYETQSMRRDGAEFWYAVSIRTVYNENGDIRLYEGSLMDITERRQIEKAERERKAAEAAGRAKSDFLANMSHEIRTPLNPIIGMTSLALSEELSPDVRSYLNTVKTSAYSLLRIINDILDFSKIDAGKLDIEHVNFNLRNVLNHVFNMFNVKSRENGNKIEIIIDDAVPLHVIGDSVRLGQVLSNLTSNALKFTENGTITIGVRRIGAISGGVTLEFSVKDTGIGIDGENLGKLFKAFSQADSSTTRKFGGTGLGLAICKRLVEMMNGTIWVESEKGRGSVFYFTCVFGLELEDVSCKEPEKLDDNFSKKKIIKTLSGSKILLVEDNIINQEVAKKIMEKAGMLVHVANSGKEALEFIVNNSFDAVLMDVEMPEMNGLEASHLIRQQKSADKLPIIAMTAHAIDDSRDKCIAAGMNDFITKPVDPEDMYLVLGKWVK